MKPLVDYIDLTLGRERGRKVKVGSLFSGVGGFDLGLERAGMEVVWQCEIDKAAQSVLRRRFPNAIIYDDVRTIGACYGGMDDSGRSEGEDGLPARRSPDRPGRGADTEHNRPDSDSTGARPDSDSTGASTVDLICGGFPCQDLSVAGRRAGLAGERSGLWYQFHRILGELAPRWVLVENVPGLLSSNGGRDFAVVLRGLVELGYGVAWRILDAQYLGVAQRRRRVFIVGCLGDRRSAAQVLFEPESLPGNPPPSREAGAGVTALTSCGVGTCGADDNQAQGGHLVAQFDGHSANGIQERVGVANTLDGDGRDGVIVTHALTAEGHDASEDGTRRGTPMVMAPAFSKRPGQQIATRQDGLSSAVTTGEPPRVMAVARNQRGELRTSDISAQLTAGGGKPGQGYPCVFGLELGNQGSGGNVGWHPGNRPFRTMDTNCPPGIAQGMAVRRLTPTECERLQGFPDDWTAEGADGPQSDSARYRQLGNAVCVNVAEWIGRRIMAVAS